MDGGALFVNGRCSRIDESKSPGVFPEIDSTPIKTEHAPIWGFAIRKDINNCTVVSEPLNPRKLKLNVLRNLGFRGPEDLAEIQPNELFFTCGTPPSSAPRLDIF